MSAARIILPDDAPLNLVFPHVILRIIHVLSARLPLGLGSLLDCRNVGYDNQSGFEEAVPMTFGQLLQPRTSDNTYLFHEPASESNR